MLHRESSKILQQTLRGWPRFLSRGRSQEAAARGETFSKASHGWATSDREQGHPRIVIAALPERTTGSLLASKSPVFKRVVEQQIADHIDAKAFVFFKDRRLPAIVGAVNSDAIEQKSISLSGVTKR